MANPEGGEIVGGSATISQNGKKLDVNQHTDKAIIDWRSFDIDVDEHTQFYQPSSGATALNRVKSNNPSQILGKLSANGNIILINPNGVFFGADSRVDVNGLIATSADIDNQRFLNDTRLSFDRPGSSDAQIINNGEISAREAGLVGLVAPQVINNGIIRARLGTVHLAAGDTAIIDLYGDGLTGVAVSGVAGKKLIENTGVIEAQGGEIHLSTATAGRMVDNLIAVKGELRAPSVSQKNGKIIISGQKSGVDIGANIDVSGKNSSETGGEIQITGDQIVVRKNAIIDASGDSGGGQVYIGGDYQGQGELYTAAQTFTEKGAFINASALEQGDGGRVIVWADGRTDFYGDILARGGNSGGDGGFVEVSGKDYLNYKGFVDTQAPLGEVGTLLLDPANIVIVNGSGDSAADGNGTFSGAPSAVVGSVAGGDTGPSSIFESELEGIAATTNISLAATNSITINNLSDNTLNLAQTAGRSVTFSTGAGGFIMSDVNDTIVTAGGALNITTTGGTSTIGNLATGAGLKTFNIGGTATVSGVINGTGGITKTGTGTLRLNGNNTYSGTTTITAGSLLLGSNTALGTGNVALNGGTLSAQGGSRTLSNNVTIGGNAAIGGSSDLQIGNFVTSGNRTLTLNNTGLFTIGGNTTLNSNLTMNGSGNARFNGIVTNNNGNRVLTVNSSGLVDLAGTLRLSNNNTNRTFTVSGTGNTAVSGVIENGGTSVSNLSKTGNGTLTLSGNNIYSGTTTITAGSLLLGSNTALGTGNVALNGGTLSAQGGSRTLSNNVTIGGNAAIGGSSDLTFNGIFGNLAADRTLTLTNTALTTITGNIPISNSGTSRRLTIAGAGNLTVNGNITNGSTSTVSAITKTNTGTLTLNGNNSFGGTTILTAGTTAAGSNTALGTGAISLNGGTLQGAGGSRTLNNNITLAANSTIAGTSDLSLNGTITNSGGNRTLTVSNTGQTSFGGTVNLSENTTNRILTIAGSGNTTFSGVIQNGGGSTAGVLTKSGTGTMIVSGNNTYAGATNITGGTLRLGAANRIANGSILSVNSGATFDLNSFSETISSITSAGSVVFGTGATLTTSGAQNYTGTVSGTNVSLVSTGGGAITATNAANDFIDALALSTTGAANVVDANNLTLGTTGVSTIAARAPNGILTLDGQVTASATSGTSITLQGGTDFVNNFGATALQTSGTARWMVFEDNPTPDTKNGLGGQNRYGCAYNAGAPDCAAGTDIPASGNVFYFATAPTLTISGLSADDKIYDATTVASLSGTGTLNGILFGDGVGLDTSSATASFDTKNVGTGKTVTASGYALSGTNLGYLLSQPSSLSADITPADLTLFGLTASNKVYDTTTAATLGSTASVSALGSDSVSLSGTAIGTFNNKNVGTAKTVTVSGLTLTGTDAGNYTLLSQPGLIADITPADLTAFGLTALDKVYDATLAAPLSGTAQINPLGADDVVLSGTAAGLFSDKNVGSSKAVTVSGLSLSGTDAGNYTFIPQTGLTANITTADILATGLSASDRIYDGTTSVILSGTAIVTPLGSDSLFLAGTPTGVFADKNTGNNKSVVISGLSLTGTDASNYNLLPQGGVTANVTPRPLTVSSITADDKNFDGTTTATISSFIFDDLLAGDSATISGLAGTFDSPAPGTNKTVTISAGTLSGTDASNYLFSLGTANDFATIFAPPSSPSESLANNLPNTFVFSSQTPLNFEIVSSFDQSGSSDIPNYKTTNFIPSSLESLIVIDPKLKEQISLEDGL